MINDKKISYKLWLVIFYFCELIHNFIFFKWRLLIMGSKTKNRFCLGCGKPCYGFRCIKCRQNETIFEKIKFIKKLK